MIISLNKKLVDVDPTFLEFSGVVYVIDFSSDYKSYVGYTRGSENLQRSLSYLIGLGRRDSGKLYPELAQAIAKSETLTVTVVATGQHHLYDRLQTKYRAVKEYATYPPHGHNYLYGETNSFGKRLIRQLLIDLREGNMGELTLPPEEDTQNELERGRPKGLPVYQYERVKATILKPVTTWRLVKEWPCLSDITAWYRKGLSNISSACKDISRTAYGYKWSHTKYERPFVVRDREVTEV